MIHDHLQCVAKPQGAGSDPGKPLNIQFAGAGSPGTISYTASDSTKPPSVQERLKALGLAGLVSYGLFNTLYYTIAFTFIWHYVAKVPSGRGLAAATTSCAQVLGMTWVGSQATKALRAGGALVFAPVVDRFLEFVRRKTNLPDKKRAFVYVILPACILFAIILFGTTILWWA